MHLFNLTTLDHVALIVKDLELSASWYKKILCLKRLHPPEWGPYPIFMVCEDESGVALFPEKERSKHILEGNLSNNGHFAFRITNENFNKARVHLDLHKVSYSFQDHIFFHSIYFNDPDGHQLEITTQVRPLNQQ